MFENGTTARWPALAGWNPEPIDPARRPCPNLRYRPEHIAAGLLSRHRRDRAAERPRA